jgi:putative drug exporter of the RND superfamily
VVVVRSERLPASDPAFRALIRSFGPGEGAVSADGHAVARPIFATEEGIEPLLARVEQSNRDGFTVRIAGEQTLSRDFTVLSESDLNKGELRLGLPAALIVLLLLVVGTLVGAAIRIAMAVISIIVALGLTALVGQAFELNLFITNMVVAMGLALGIDSSLFIVARLREERSRGAETRDAILTVAGTATRAVVFSGSAFVLAMSAMLLVPDTTLRSLGLGAVLVGLVSVLVALTFHPALLMVLGDRVERGRIPGLRQKAGESRRWHRAVSAVVRRPALSLAAGVLVMLALAAPVLGLQMGSAGASSLPDSAVAEQGLAALEKDFAAGATDPVTLVLDSRGVATAGGVDRLRAALAGDRDFAAAGLADEQVGDVTAIAVPLTGFATGQLVAFQEMGFGIAVALALDATLVRMLVIPAAMKLLGERNWYLPKRLRWLPDLRVEGDTPASWPASTAPATR